VRGGQERAGLPGDPAKKIVPPRAVAGLFSRLRREGQRIVLTNGCFDILHAGHARYLRQAAALGDVLVVGLNSDASVRRLKGTGRPVQPERDRAYLLASLESVSYVVVFPEDTPDVLVRRVVPHVLVKGGDWKGKEIVGAGFVRENGGTVRTLRYLEGRSTTSIIRRASGIDGRRPQPPSGPEGKRRSPSSR
jgi:D-beta-D-heptose 7-phosphate kinase/D-beta-D-heptose 1-phosphate adenosyltransferase